MSSQISAATSECASATGHFNGHAEALKRSMWHCLMQHDVQGYIGSHGTLPLGNYSLRIALVAARATINKTSMQNVPTLLSVSMNIAMRQYYTTRIAQWRRFMTFIKATKRRHRASTHFDRHQLLQLTWWPLIIIGV